MTSEQDTPVKDIIQAVLFDDKKSKDPISTKPDIMKSGNYLHDLDKAIQTVIDRIIDKQNEMNLLSSGCDRLFLTVKFDGISKELKLKRLVPVSQLKQYKTDFIKMNKQSPLQEFEKVSVAFVEYVQQFESEY